MSKNKNAEGPNNETIFAIPQESIVFVVAQINGEFISASIGDLDEDTLFLVMSKLQQTINRYVESRPPVIENSYRPPS